MTMMEAAASRHSVRQYRNEGIAQDTVFNLRGFIRECNASSGLSMQLILNDPDTFTGLLVRYGKFKHVNHYIAIVGKDAPDTAEKCGYYGEKVVLYAQQIGLNTCWVGASFKKGRCRAKVAADEKLYLIIAVGHGQNQGVQHSMHPASRFDLTQSETPDWYRSGLEQVRLAPSAMNLQRARFQLKGDQVYTQPGRGAYNLIDLGIAKCHFELGAGHSVLWGEHK